MKRAIVVLASAFLAFAGFAGAQSVAGSGFGVSPVTLEFDGLLRGESYSGELRLQNQFDDDVVVTATPQGDLASWMKTSPMSPFRIPAGTTKIVTVTLDVPADAANGDYLGGLRLQAAGAQPTGSGSSVNMELVPAVRATVGGVQRTGFSLEGARILTSEEHRGISFVVDLINTGNVRGAPELRFTAKDGSGAEVLAETVKAQTVAAGGHAAQALSTAEGLPVGEYVGSVALASGGAARANLPFKIVPAGTLALSEGKSGELVSVDVDPAVKPGRVAKVAAVFKNTGTKDILAAKANFEILLGSERIAVLASDPVVVPAGQQAELPAYWTPDAPGLYTVQAWVAFDGLKTETRTANMDAGEALAPSGGAASGGAPAAPAPSLIPGVGLTGVVAALAAALLVFRKRR